MTNLPENNDRMRLLLMALAVVIGLGVASVPLVASIFSEPDAPSGSAPASSGANAGNASDSPAPGAVEESPVAVKNVVPCVQQDEGGAASEINEQAELKDVRLPCLTENGQQSSQSLAEQFAGKPTVVNVWAWWCGPCRKELPVLQSLAESNPQWNVVGVHLDAKAQAGADFLKELGVNNLASYQDSNHTFDTATNIPKVVPVTLVYRPDGTRAKLFVRTFDDNSEMQQQINEALAA